MEVDPIRVVLAGYGHLGRELAAGLEKDEGFAVVGVTRRSVDAPTVTLPSGRSVPLSADLAALLIEKMNPEIFTCVELLNRNNAAHLNMVGVEEILVADEYAGNILANAQRTRGIIRMLDELFDPSVGNQFYKLPLPTPWIGKTVGDIYQQLKSEHGATLISLETRIGEGYDILVNPPNDRELKESDRIMMIAPTAPNFSKIR